MILSANEIEPMATIVLFTIMRKGEWKNIDMNDLIDVLKKYGDGELYDAVSSKKFKVFLQCQSNRVKLVTNDTSMYYALFKLYCALGMTNMLSTFESMLETAQSKDQQEKLVSQGDLDQQG